MISLYICRPSWNLLSPRSSPTHGKPQISHNNYEIVVFTCVCARHLKSSQSKLVSSAAAARQLVVTWWRNVTLLCWRWMNLMTRHIFTNDNTRRPGYMRRDIAAWRWVMSRYWLLWRWRYIWSRVELSYHQVLSCEAYITIGYVCMCI